MISLRRLFENWFADIAIIISRLVLFAEYTEEYLKDNNTNGNNTVMLGILGPAIAAARKEMNETDQSTGASRQKTSKVDAMMKVFANTMRGVYHYLAFKYGKDSELSALIFPNGLTEYTEAAKEDMPMLVERVRVLAGENVDNLGEENVSLMQSMKTLWDAARNEQEQKIGDKKQNIAERNEARMVLELALVVIVHTVGARHPGDEDTCLAYFREELLDVPRNSSLEDNTDDIGPGDNILGGEGTDPNG